MRISPATVRHVMAELEQLGFLHSPHTSAGRVPTQQAYRFFVDSMIASRELKQAKNRAISEQLPSTSPLSKKVKTASNLLSELTEFVGVVSLPERKSFAFRHIDFVPLSERQILVILVFMDGEVENRIIETATPYTPSALEQAANYMNKEYSGLLLADIRARLVSDLNTARNRMDEIMRSAVSLADSAFEERARSKVVVRGEHRLVGLDDFADIQELRGLLEAIREKRQLMQLLEESVQARGVKLFIGEETGDTNLSSCSLVTAPYDIDGDVVGVLGVIGPQRMDYKRVISVVQATAQALGAALKAEDK